MSHDLQWRLEQGIPPLQSAVAAGPAPRPFISTSAFTCSLVIHVLALVATVWLASRPSEQVTRSTATQSPPFRRVELSDGATAARVRPELSQAQSPVTNDTRSANAAHLGGTIRPIEAASVWRRIAGSVSRVAVTAALVIGMVPAPNLASATQPSTTASAVPEDPIVAILDAFRTHQIVAVGDPHGNEQVHAFRLALVRDPRIADVVNDIVVEFGNALHQGVIDRFVAGEDVPYKVLRKVWRDTTIAAPNWDLPIYEQFFRAVRDVNATLPHDRQLRVLLGDPPLDWGALNTPDDFVRFMKSTEAIRSAHPAQIIEREVIKRNRRALVIYGEAHFWRVSTGSSRSLIRRIEDSGARAFTISTRTTLGGDLRTLQPNVASWRIPSLAVLRGTTLGAASYRFYMPYLAHLSRIHWRSSDGGTV